LELDERLDSARCSVDIEDPAQLDAYLRASGRIAPSESVTFTALSGGVSNRTVRVNRPSGGDWVIKQSLERLRVEAEWLCSPRRIEQEARGIEALSRLTPGGTIPRLIFQDPACQLLAMEAVPLPHENWKSLLLAGRLEMKHFEDFARLLAKIHVASARERALFERDFSDTSFFEVLRLEPYYRFAVTQIPEAAEFLEELIRETRLARYCLVHGDYSPKNVLVHEGKLILLDHEVIHFGDPAFDLGFSLTHFLSKAHHLPQLRGQFAEAAEVYWNVYWNVYHTRLETVPFGTNYEDRVVRNTLGCLLARVAGRSPLEYLDGQERRNQAQVVVALMGQPPRTVEELITRFTGEIGRFSK
jgi:aminoglycoside phosphotransferase (APT) family kinase protein